MKRLLVILILGAVLLTSCARNQIKEVIVKEDTSEDYLDVQVDAIYQKANTLYQDGKYADAAVIYLEGLKYDIQNSTAIYNLACCYGLLGDGENASKYLKHSINKGYRDFEHIMNDPDFDNVKEDAEFKELFSKIEEQQAKSKTPDLTIEYQEAGTHLKKYTKLPEDFDVDTEYKLLIGLHGWGDNAENYTNIWKSFEDPKLIYICPEAPYAFLSGDRIGYSWFEWTEDEELGKAMGEDIDKYVRDVIMEAKERYNISETYLFGFSQGSGLSFTTGIENHDIVDGIICFGGWLDDRITDEEIQEASKLKVYIAHGKDDKVVEPKSSDVAFERMSKHCKDIKINRFEGAHQIDRPSLKEAEEWLLK